MAEAPEVQTEEAEVTTETPEQKVEQAEVDWKAKAETLANDVKTLQRSLTKQGYELGELRQLKPMLDKVLLQQVEKKEPTDFFSNPESAVRESIDSHPKLQAMTQAVDELRKQTMLVELVKHHPDYREITQDPKFLEWVEGSKIRTRMLIDADQRYDFEAGNELLANWKERKLIATTADVKSKAEQAQAETLKAAKVDTGSGVSGKKVFNRLELMRLRQTDPEKYAQLNVSKLYAEGRVK